MAKVGWKCRRATLAVQVLSRDEKGVMYGGGKNGLSQKADIKNLCSRSFVEVAKGSKNGIQEKGDEGNKKLLSMLWDSNFGDVSWLSKCAMGVLKDFVNVSSMNQRWCNSHVPQARLVWMECIGVPLNVWCNSFFMKLGWLLGEPLMLDNDCSLRRRLDRGRILRLIPFDQGGSRQIKVKAEDFSFVVRVEEDSAPVDITWFARFLGLRMSFPISNSNLNGLLEMGRPKSFSCLEVCKLPSNMFAQGDLALGASLGNNGKWGMRNEVISKPILDKRVNKVCLKAYKFVSFSIGQREMALGADNALPKKGDNKATKDSEVHGISKKGKGGEVGLRKVVNCCLSKPFLEFAFNVDCLNSIGDKRKSCRFQCSKVKPCFAFLESVKLDIDKSRSIGYREACDGGGPNSGLEEKQKSGIHVINGSGKDSEEFSSNFYIESCSAEVEFALLSKNPKGRESYLPVKCHNMKELWALR
ncbi:hypothetical protein LWI28_007187 [Acer negundo]|uniref:DUF4283 domain-containing protein n=1 Tax=Acer negundo TaxID=4023 RepID=A0AAD5P3V0_ACENE|nr:hypothetical protein LWI28_007187 [Acer negundo]